MVCKAWFSSLRRHKNPPLSDLCWEIHKFLELQPPEETVSWINKKYKLLISLWSFQQWLVITCTISQNNFRLNLWFTDEQNTNSVARNNLTVIDQSSSPGVHRDRYRSGSLGSPPGLRFFFVLLIVHFVCDSRCLFIWYEYKLISIPAVDLSCCSTSLAANAQTLHLLIVYLLAGLRMAATGKTKTSGLVHVHPSTHEMDVTLEKAARAVTLAIRVMVEVPGIHVSLGTAVKGGTRAERRDRGAIHETTTDTEALRAVTKTSEILEILLTGDTWLLEL